MNVVVRGERASSPQAIEGLARRMVHPLCGLDSRVGFMLRGSAGPTFAVAGGELTGVHRLLGRDEPGSYHIGGVGLTRHEALIRTLGESAERYCQLVSVASGTVSVRFAPRPEVIAEGAEIVDPCSLAFFDDEQYARPDFLFQRPDPEASYGWVAMGRVPDKRPVLVPAQLALVGYGPHRARGEPWVASAMTTGTATHRTTAAARRGALLELVQVDCAMGCWYGDRVAPAITLGSRLAAVRALVERHRGRTVNPSFHYLPNPDLPAHTVACVLREAGVRRPRAVVGLGCEMRLSEAAYKALLEAVGVLQLARIGMITAELEGAQRGAAADEAAIYDLDSNVGHYADGGGADQLAAKFPAAPGSAVADADLPPDAAGPDDEVAEHLAGAMVDRGVRLFELDLTTVDVADLGLTTTRVWSPDLLALAIPSLPPRGHPRFAAYGSVTTDRPHPYP